MSTCIVLDLALELTFEEVNTKLDKTRNDYSRAVSSTVVSEVFASLELLACKVRFKCTTSFPFHGMQEAFFRGIHPC